MIKKTFKYIEPLWLGTHKTISLRRILAIFFSINLISNLTFAIQNWEAQKSYSDLAFVLGIEAALIAALLTLTTYSNMINSRMNRGRHNDRWDYDRYDDNRYDNNNRYNDRDEVIG